MLRFKAGDRVVVVQDHDPQWIGREGTVTAEPGLPFDYEVMVDGDDLPAYYDDHELAPAEEPQ